jgi:hypothetical protein
MLRHQGEGATLSRTLRETLNRQVILHSGKRGLGYRASEGETHVFGPGGMERHAVRDATDMPGESSRTQGKPTHKMRDTWAY